MAHSHANGSVKRRDEPARSVAPASRSFLNLTIPSGLANVFGSQVSLAELNGDVAPSRPQTPALNLSPLGARLQGVASARAKTDAAAARKAADESAASSTDHSLAGSPASPQPASLPAMSQGLVPLSAPTVVFRSSLLFVFGVAYGYLSKRLHNNVLVSLYTVATDDSALLPIVWGFQGVLMGFLLPFLDWLFPERRRLLHGKGGADWSSIVRAIAAFLGVAYGIRNLQWSSARQAASTWGLVNPFLWVILDATRNGFILSTLTAFIGMFVFASVYPDQLPLRTASLFAEVNLPVIVLVGSMFFCCSIGFGNLGRRLLSLDRRG